MTETKTKKTGRPEHEPTEQQRRQVEMMSAFGNTLEQIATIQRISVPTLTKHYADELAVGRTKADKIETGDLAGAALLLQEMVQSVKLSTQAAEEFRDWTASVMLQLADVAKDGIGALDRDEIEIARHVLDFIANAPTRLGLAPATGQTS